MSETLIKNFTQISKADTEIAGGKGASLGEMTQAGIPVPEGFVILASAFDRFLEETDLNVEIDAVLDMVDIKEVHTVENASEKIQAIILSKEIPQDIKTKILKFHKNLDCKFVAVRSSATSEDSASAAWAGQLDSFLNTTEKTLLENVKKCWASLFTPRAIFYRFEKKLSKDKISVAVVVQKMIDSEKSGIAFSVHPVTQDKNQIIIEAGFGLGEAIVSGSITPDSYVVDKQGFSILDINVNEQTKALYKQAKGGNKWKELEEKGKEQVLSEKEIIELSKLIVKIENHYDFPCDIEWVKEKGKFYIVQSRPITTIQKEEKITYYNGAIKDNIVVDYEKFTSKYTKEKWIKVGSWKIPRIAFDLFNCSQSKYYLKKYGIEDIPPIKYLTVGNDVYVAKKELNIINDSIFRIIDSENYKFINKFDKLQTKYRLEIKKEIELLKQTNALNIELITSILEKTLSILVVFEILRDMSNFFEEAIINRFKELSIDPIPLAELLYKDTKSETYKLNHEISVLSTKKKPIPNDKLNNLIKRYGYLNQYFLSGNEYYKKDILEQISKYVKKDTVHKKYNFKDNKLKKFIELMNRFSIVRFLNNEITNKAIFKLKYLIKNVAKKNDLSYEEVLSLPLEEFYNLLNQKRITLNKKMWGTDVAVISIDKNYILNSKDYNKFKKEYFSIKYSNNKEITGTPTFEGIVRGKAKIVMGSEDFHKFNDNDILICSMTDPNYLPLMKKASAFITDIGGILCHAAIVSRELNKPCIIGTKIATKIISDNDLIEVNSFSGKIRILKKSKK